MEPQAIMSAQWGWTAWVSTSSPQTVPHHRELLPLLGHRIKGGSKSLLAAPPKRLPLGGSREEQSLPQEDWGVLELWRVEREGKVAAPQMTTWLGYATLHVPTMARCRGQLEPTLPSAPPQPVWQHACSTLLYSLLGFPCTT